MPPDQGVPASHGLDMTGRHPPLQDPHLQMNLNEKAIFDYLLKPADSYNDDGDYWADLSIPKRIKSVGKSDAQEAARELASIWRMFKAEPLEPMRYYFRDIVLPGAGLGLWGYVLFSIGNLKPLFEKGSSKC